LILVDAGFGTKHDHGPNVERPSGTVLDALRRLGIGPQDIDFLINTHLHTDHAGGNTNRAHAETVATFTRASYVIQRAEWEYASSPDRNRDLFREDDFIPLRDRALLVGAEFSVTEEVRCVLAAGHTPGHQVILVESGGAAAALIGDMAPTYLHLQHPAWTSSLDSDPRQSYRSKQWLLTWAGDRRGSVGLTHDGHGVYDWQEAQREVAP